MDDGHWAGRGACRGASPDDLFVEGAAQRAAREVCADCEVRLECLVDALDHRILFGVWGGLTERERRSLLRRYPDVLSWREQLEEHPELTGWSTGYTGPSRRSLRRSLTQSRTQSRTPGLTPEREPARGR